MSDFIPQRPAGIKIGGLSPKAQKLQALREKAANARTDSKTTLTASTGSFKAKNSATRKTAFQRKAT